MELKVSHTSIQKTIILTTLNLQSGYPAALTPGMQHKGPHGLFFAEEIQVHLTAQNSQTKQRRVPPHGDRLKAEAFDFLMRQFSQKSKPWAAMELICLECAQMSTYRHSIRQCSSL